MGAARIWWACPVETRSRLNARARQRTPPEPHQATRTGRTRPNPSRRRGTRSLDAQHEWLCECGATGWSVHIDMLHLPVRGR